MTEQSNNTKYITLAERLNDNPILNPRVNESKISQGELNNRKKFIEKFLEKYKDTGGEESWEFDFDIDDNYEIEVITPYGSISNLKWGTNSKFIFFDNDHYYADRTGELKQLLRDISKYIK